ncbi:MAG: metallophosphoesterase [Clostridia bacterium]|nr:metallophosphoesterase [Clostridia bacterium]
MKRLKRLEILILCALVFLTCGGTRADEQPEASDAERNDGKTASFLWITDLQDCSYHPGEYVSVAEWCEKLAEENDVTFLVGTGDYVGKWYSERQWTEFRAFLDIINSTLPGLYIAGNHD